MKLGKWLMFGFYMPIFAAVKTSLYEPYEGLELLEFFATYIGIGLLLGLLGFYLERLYDWKNK